MNPISKAYIKIIFSIFRRGINSFYNSNTDQNSTNKNYQKMLEMKQLVYKVFNFLIRSFENEKNEYLVKINFNKLPFYVRGLILSDIVMTSEAWEPYVKDIFVTKKSDVIIDVGAHIGTYSIPKATEIGEEGKVIALEPNPMNSKILEKNITLNKLNNIVILEKAAGSKNEFVNLSLSSDPMLSMITNEENKKSVKIECIKLDSLIKKLDLQKVNWLKIDAEGSEIQVLEGSKEILEKYHPKIIVEVRKENEEKMMKILESYGYDIKYLNGEYFFAKI